jgi:hypothetical protein
MAERHKQTMAWKGRFWESIGFHDKRGLELWDLLTSLSSSCLEEGGDA